MASSVPHVQQQLRFVHDGTKVIAFNGVTGERLEVNIQQYDQFGYSESGWGFLKPKIGMHVPKLWLKDVLNTKVFKNQGEELYFVKEGITSWQKNLIKQGCFKYPEIVTGGHTQRLIAKVLDAPFKEQAVFWDCRCFQDRLCLMNCFVSK